MYKSYKPRPPAPDADPNVHFGPVERARASRSAEFSAGHDDARPDLKVDYVYEGEPLESNYLRNRYGGDD